MVSSDAHVLVPEGDQSINKQKKLHLGIVKGLALAESKSLTLVCFSHIYIYTYIYKCI